MGQLMRTLLAVSLCIFSAGCSLLYKPVGGTLNAYAEEFAIKDFLTYQDVDLLCQSGGSLAPLINSFKAVGTPTHKTQLTLLLLSGFCAEQQAHEYEIAALIANQSGNYSAAQTLSALKQRHLGIAASRQYRSYLDTAIAYPSDGSTCPTLHEEQDELLFLLGNLQGLEAIVNDGKSGAAANVPKNIANDIYRAMDCVNNETWWGVPESVRAALLAFLPNLDRAKAAQIDAILDQSIALGKNVNTPLAETVALTAWEGQGNSQRLERLIKEHFEYAKNAELDSRWLTINFINNRHLENKADIIRLEEKQAISADPAQPYLMQDETPLDIDLDDL